jgi:hypothetical protein
VIRGIQIGAEAEFAPLIRPKNLLIAGCGSLS